MFMTIVVRYHVSMSSISSGYNLLQILKYFWYMRDLAVMYFINNWQK